MVTASREKPECPQLKRHWHDGTPLCKLNDKFCFLESGTTCDYYEEWLKEEQV